MFKKHFYFLFSWMFTLIFITGNAQPQKNYNAGEVQLALKKLSTVGSVLYIAAHPDDENTRLLSYLANEKLLRTAYLSITRGDGGQNLIGAEQAELLGIIRTQELLAARRTDGAEQFFTRANDFGYSKTAEETMEIWGKEKILSDVVWVIRQFRPDIIITRFPTTGEGGHGHHTASAILAQEAFIAAANPLRFPEQLQHVETWQAKRLLWNNVYRSRNPGADISSFLKLDIGKYNSLLGKSYGEIAAESRSMHKSQGFGTPKTRGPIIEYFKHLEGDSATADIFQGLDFSWSRVKGGQKLGQLLQEAYIQYRAEKPESIVPVLLQAYSELSGLKDNYWRIQKKKELEEMILACSGLWLEAYAPDFSVVPGTKIKLTASVIQRSDFPFKLERLNFPGNSDTSLNKVPGYNELLNTEKTVTIPATTPYSNPYWLDQKSQKGIFNVSDPTLIGSPENKPSISIGFVFSYGKQSFTFNRPVVFKWVDPVNGEQYRTLEIVPPVTLNMNRNVFVFPGKEPKQIQVLLKSGMENVSGNIKLLLPENWKVEPTSVPFSLKTKEEEMSINFTVSPPETSASAEPNWESLKAIAEINGEVLSKSIARVQYDHIPIQTLLPEAEAKLVALDLKKKGNKIGYVPGTDEIPALLEYIDYDVTILTDELISDRSLKDFDAIIVGIRAYNTNERMKHYYPKLMEYVNSGGTMIVQYNTLSTVKTEIGPYPFKISRERVTVEEAPVTFEDPAHPILNTPNKISPKDFDNWIQERGLHFANEWDPKYETVISMNDPGEKPQKGSLLVAKYGEGYFMYTGLSFFRELPAGVPGAYRLFVNMISYGK